MKNVFVDSSVFIAACAAIKGASARILQLCHEEKVRCFISPYVIQETQKNVSFKLGLTGMKRFQFFIHHIPFILARNPTDKEISQYARIITGKDAPILASASASKTQYLLTFDQKHLLQDKIKKFAKKRQIQIMTPGEFLKVLDLL